MLFGSLCVCLLLVSPASVCCGRCVAHLYEDGRPVTKLTPASPVNYLQAKELCNDVARSELLHSIDDLGVEEKAACPGNALVPLAIVKGSSESNKFVQPDYLLSNDTVELLMTLKEPADELANKSLDFGGYPVFGAVNLTTRRWHFVNYHHKFDCILCQRNVMVLEHPGSVVDDNMDGKYTTLGYFQITATSTKPRASQTVTHGEVQAVRSALAALLAPNRDLPVKPKFHRTALQGDAVQLQFGLFARVLQSVADSSRDVRLLDEYVVTLGAADRCPLEQTTDVDGDVMVWQPTQATVRYGVSGGSFQSAKVGSGLIPRRDCIFNRTSYKAAWSEVSYWRPTWEPCSDELESTNEEVYKEVLGEEGVNRHIHQLQRFTAAPINTTALKQVTSIVNREVDRFNAVNETMTRDLVNISSRLLLDGGQDACLAQEDRAYVLVSSLMVSEPVSGLTVEFLDGPDPNNTTVTLDRARTAEPRPNQQFSVHVSDDLVAVHERMALFVYWIENPVLAGGMLRATRGVEMTVALYFNPEHRMEDMPRRPYVDCFVDVAFRADGQWLLATNTSMACAGWSRESQRWVTEGCLKLKANRGDLTVCRCRAKFFGLDAYVPGVATAKFALNKEQADNK